MYSSRFKNHVQYLSPKRMSPDPYLYILVIESKVFLLYCDRNAWYNRGWIRQFSVFYKQDFLLLQLLFFWKKKATGDTMLNECLIKIYSPLTDILNNGSLFLWWQCVFENVFEKTKFPKIRIFSSFVYQRCMWEKTKKSTCVIKPITRISHVTKRV